VHLDLVPGCVLVVRLAVADDGGELVVPFPEDVGRDLEEVADLAFDGVAPAVDGGGDGLDQDAARRGGEGGRVLVEQGGPPSRRQASDVRSLGRRLPIELDRRVAFHVQNREGPGRATSAGAGSG
jgi:hypothetical protein